VQYSEPLPSAAIAWAERQSGVLTRAQLSQLRPPGQSGGPARPPASSSAPRPRHLHPRSPRADLAPIRVGCGPSRRPVGTADWCISRRVRGLTIPSLPILLSVDSTVGVQSPLEYRWIKNVERPHRLPIPARPYQLPSGAVADGAYEESGSCSNSMGGAITTETRLRRRTWSLHPFAELECVRSLDIGRTDTHSRLVATCRRRWLRRPRGPPAPCLRSPC
jgi:hypothetical protein